MSRFFHTTRWWFAKEARAETIRFDTALRTLQSLPLPSARRFSGRFLKHKVRRIHERITFFYRPYSKYRTFQDFFFSNTQSDSFLATRWLVKKHASVAAEFRALDEMLPNFVSGGVDPVALFELAESLDRYVERHAFRFSEEALAETINAWQKEHGHALSLSETEAVAPILRLLSLDKLSLLAVRVAEYEHARREAVLYYRAQGPRHPRVIRHCRQLAKRYSLDYAGLFSASFYRLAEQSGHIFETNDTDSQIYGNPVTAFDFESHLLKNLNDHARVLLRSLPLLGEFRWTRLLKKTNSLHKILSRDPARIYAAMTTDSQGYYRAKAAMLAYRSGVSEEIVAQSALELAIAENSAPKNHIGYYIADQGIQDLLRRIRRLSKISPWQSWYLLRRDVLLRYGYLFTLFAVPLTLAMVLSMAAFSAPILITLTALPIIFKVSKHLVDSAFMSAMPGDPTPQLNFSKKIPPGTPAILVIPGLLKDSRTIHRLLDKLETIYLDNKSGALSFCLLFDPIDTLLKPTDTNQSLINELRQAIDDLNTRYGETDRFTFFLRTPLWAPRQGRWMGWERKRGKLLDFSRFLRGRPLSSAYIFSGRSIPRADFIITLDEDSRLPRDFAKDILGIHAHPLQQPILDGNHLIHGYTFIQPEIRQWYKNRHRFHLPRFVFDERRWSAYADIGPEVYQDIFKEGSFSGKGCFHIDSYLALLDMTLPTDQILSHDLLEGSLARTLATPNIQIFDEFPETVGALLGRNHRWTRGDWQIIDWLLPTVRDENGSVRPNSLGLIHRLKIFDNLIQSLARPAVFALVIIAWWLNDGLLLGFVGMIFFFELFIFDTTIDWMRWTASLVTGRWRALNYRFSRTALRTLRLVRQALVEAAILPYAALDTLHAVMTALWRRYVSGRHMLEWVASAHFRRIPRRTILLPIVILLSGTIADIAGWHPTQPIFLALSVFWLSFPLLMRYLDQPYRDRIRLSEEALTDLRQTALKTWFFFADHVTPKTHHLPPDYVRFAPRPAIATYTSITNIGFYLASIPLAQKFGYIPLGEALDRFDATFTILQKLKRHRGHFHNWYDLVSTEPAQPIFISSVDSGNLAACLIVVRQWLKEFQRHDPHIDSSLSDMLTGLYDIASFARESIAKDPRLTLFAEDWNGIVALLHPANRKNSPKDAWETLRAVTLAMDALVFPDRPPEAMTLFQKRLSEISSAYRNGQISGADDFKTRRRITALIGNVDALLGEMRFGFLKSRKRQLISVGYHVPTERLETRLYQTLASEARITDIIALAQGVLSLKGWSKLNRKIVESPFSAGALFSWTGTLFEYLMPGIFIEEYPDSASGQSICSAIRANRRFAKHHGLPCWGLSESGYYEFDKAGNYRYKPFGVPALALSPLADNRPVISAYSIAMALPYAPTAAWDCLSEYARHDGVDPRYGYLESIDFSDNPHGAPVRMCMSHHQGMILATLGNIFFDRMVIRLFESHPLIQNSLFILDEILPAPSKEPFPKPTEEYLRSTIRHPRTP